MAKHKIFFISYTKVDEAKAEWIANRLEDAGYATVIQAWDIRPGNNFVLAMDETTRQAMSTILVLSYNYLQSEYASAEWAAAFRGDPTGIRRKVIPVRVDGCHPEGLLGSIVYIDLFGLSEDEATETLLEGVKPGRNKPSNPVTHTEAFGTRPTILLPFNGELEEQEKKPPPTMAGSNYTPRIPPPLVLDFVGREAELETLRRTLRRGENTPLSLAVVGMPGVGKSALVSAAVYELIDDLSSFPNGIAWIPCEDCQNLDGLRLVYDRILLAWDTHPSKEDEERATTPQAELEIREQIIRRKFHLIRTLQQTGSALIVLDDVERSLPLSRLAKILVPLGVTLLCTARHQPTALPWMNLLSLEPLDAETATQMFIKYHLARGGREDRIHDADLVQRVTHLLGGLPLAIALAAARAALSGMNMTDLAEALGKADRLGKLKDPLDETQSVQYAFDQTLALLSPDQQAHFLILSLPQCADVPRSVMEQLMGAVYADPTLLTDEGVREEVNPVGEDLETFAALSLLSLYTLEHGIASSPYPLAQRVRLHPLIREYCWNHWCLQAEETQTGGLETLIEAIEELTQTYRNEHDVLAHEEELIVNALRHAAEHKVALIKLCDVIESVSDYFFSRGRYQLGKDLIALQLIALNDLKDYIDREFEKGEADKATYDIASEKVLNAQGRATGNMATMSYSLGHTEEGIVLWEKALAIFHECNDSEQASIMLANLGAAASRIGNIPKAFEYVKKALEIANGTGDRLREATFLSHLGSLHNHIGEVGLALQYYEAALTIFQEKGDKRGESSVLNGIGVLLSETGDMKRALRCYETALVIRREIGNPGSIASTLDNIGSLFARLELYEQAIGPYEEALAIRREIGDRRGEGVTLNNLALILTHQRHFTEAQGFFEKSLSISREVKERAEEGTVLNNLSSFARENDNLEEAMRYLQEALPIFRETIDRYREAATLHNMGQIAAEIGDQKTASTYFEQALVISREIKDRGDESIILFNMGLLAKSRREKQKARDFLQRSLAISEELGTSQQANRTRERLDSLDRPASSSPM